SYFLIGTVKTARRRFLDHRGHHNMIPLLRLSLILVLLSLAMPLARAQAPNAAARTPANDGAPVISDPLVRVLVSKGVLTPEEGRAVSTSGTPAEQRDRLATLLRDKGLISPAEFEAIRTVAPSADVVAAVQSAKGERVSATAQSAPQPAATPNVIAAVAPTRLLSIDPPNREGLIPDIKLGTGAALKLYGFFKTSVIYDSSSPQGNDFPLPLLAADTG